MQKDRIEYSSTGCFLRLVFSISYCITIPSTIPYLYEYEYKHPLCTVRVYLYNYYLRVALYCAYVLSSRAFALSHAMYSYCTVLKLRFLQLCAFRHYRCTVLCVSLCLVILRITVQSIESRCIDCGRNVRVHIRLVFEQKAATQPHSFD